jgi:hypothetical protein
MTLRAMSLRRSSSPRLDHPSSSVLPPAGTSGTVQDEAASAVVTGAVAAARVMDAAPPDDWVGDDDPLAFRSAVPPSPEAVEAGPGPASARGPWGTDEEPATTAALVVPLPDNAAH